MSMHLHHPSLTLSGKKKGKKKWASAEQKRQAEILAQQWEDLKKRHATAKPIKKNAAPTNSILNKSPVYRDQLNNRPASLNSWVTGAVASKPVQHYTGDKMLGIGTMHKSNAVPIFNTEEAIDISRMRRG